MVQIPDYTAQRGIDPINYPETRVDNSIGEALNRVGGALASVGAQFSAKQQELDRYNTMLKQEQLSNAQDQQFNEVVQNGAADGSDIVKKTMDGFEKDYKSFVGTIKDPKLRAQTEVVWENLRGKRLLAAQSAAEKKQYSYVLATTNDSLQQEIDGGKLNTQDDWNSYFDKVVKQRIDIVEKDPLQRQKLYDVYRKNMRDQFFQRVPASVATAGRQQGQAAGIPVNVEATFGKQLAFAHHELQTSEGRAGQMLKNAQTVEDAVRAGLAYERPKQDEASIAFGNRVSNARKVLAGQAPPRAMQAFSFFKSQGYSDVQAAGFVGSLMQESGQNLNPHAANPRDPGTSIGIGQWNRERKAQMLAFTGTAGDFPMSVPNASAAAGVPAMPTGGIFEGMTPAEWRSYTSAARAQVSAQIASTVPDQLAALQSTGAYEGRAPTQEEFVAAYGEDGAAKFDAYQHAVMVAEQSFKYKDMSTDEIMADLKAREAAIGSGEGAAQNLKDYEQLQQAANPIVTQNERERRQYLADVERRSTAATNAQIDIAKQREVAFVQMQREKAAAAEAAKAEIAFRDKDPAGYVFAKNPGVRMAWRETNGNDPASLRAAVAATISAQQAIGIPGDKINPLPLDQAQAIASRVKDASLAPVQRLTTLLQPFGMVDTPEHQEQMARQLVRAGLSPQIANVIEAWKRDDPGATQRIFQAAMIDRENAPKLGSDENKLNSAVVDAMLGSGTIGATFYGMDLGDPRSSVAASSDIDLVKNLARLSMASGKGQDEAIQQAVTDIFGTVDAVDESLPSGGNVLGLVDTGTDKDALFKGFGEANKHLVDVMQGYIARAYGQLPANATPQMQAIYRASHINEMNRVMADGVWRNNGSGWSFWDPNNRGFVSDDTGKPIMFTTDELLQLGGTAPVETPVTTDPMNFQTPTAPSDQPFGVPPSPEPVPGKQGAIDLPSPRSSLAANLKAQQQKLFADGPLAKVKEMQG